MCQIFSQICANFRNWIRGGRLAVLKYVLDSYLLNQTPQSRQAQNAKCVSFKGQSVSNPSVNKDSEIMLWHYRVGHPNFMYLEKLFPSLFRNRSPKFFNCEICQLVKHTRTNYPSLSYTSSQLFT